MEEPCQTGITVLFKYMERVRESFLFSLGEKGADWKTEVLQPHHI